MSAQHAQRKGELGLVKTLRVIPNSIFLALSKFYFIIELSDKLNLFTY